MVFTATSKYMDLQNRGFYQRITEFYENGRLEMSATGRDITGRPAYYSSLNGGSYPRKVSFLISEHFRKKERDSYHIAEFGCAEGVFLNTLMNSISQEILPTINATGIDYTKEYEEHQKVNNTHNINYIHEPAEETKLQSIDFVVANELLDDLSVALFKLEGDEIRVGAIENNGHYNLDVSFLKIDRPEVREEYEQGMNYVNEFGIVLGQGINALHVGISKFMKNLRQITNPNANILIMDYMTNYPYGKDSLPGLSVDDILDPFMNLTLPVDYKQLKKINDKLGFKQKNFGNLDSTFNIHPHNPYHYSWVLFEKN